MPSFCKFPMLTTNKLIIQILKHFYKLFVCDNERNKKMHKTHN